LTLFADASALISILTQESDALALANCLEYDPDRIDSPISAWETVAGLCHAYRFSVEQAGHRLRLLAAELGFRLVSIGEVEFSLAMDAYDRFGKRPPSRETEHGRLLRLRMREGQPCEPAVQGQRLHQNRYPANPPPRVITASARIAHETGRSTRK
jgi:uncharacterized protein with PIN domain